MKILSAITEWYSKNRTRDGELEFWIVGYILVVVTFSLLLGFVVTEPLSIHPFPGFPSPVKYEAFPQFTRVVVLVFLSGMVLTFFVFPICMYLRPLRKRRKPIAISIVVLLSISLLLVRILRIRLLGI